VDLAAGYLDRRDPDARAVVELAALLSPAVLVEPELLRAMRLEVGGRIGVAAEGDLWFSPLTRDHSADGFTFLPEIVPALQDRLRRRLERADEHDPVWRIGDILERVHADAQPLTRLAERVTWLAVSQGRNARSRIEQELDSACQAVAEGRGGVARWAARELPAMPSEVQETGAAHRLGRIARPHLSAPIQLSAELAGELDETFVDLETSEPSIDLPVLRSGARLLLGAVEAERALGIQVPDTDPRIVGIDAGSGEETVSISAGGVVERTVGLGRVRLRTARGDVYELPELAVEPPPQAPVPRPGAVADAVVIIPDFIGSDLERDGRLVWAREGGLLRMARRLQKEDLTLVDDDPERDEVDGISAIRLAETLSVVPAFWKAEGYAVLQRFIERVGATPGESLFELPYDWRRDHRVAALRLARLAPEWLARWRERSGDADARLIVVAHGNGGLVGRYFTEVLGGWATTRLLVTLGTPFRGTLNALRMLVEGYGPRPMADLTEAARSWTSVYQMLPTYRCVDPGDGALARVTELDGLPGVDVRRAVAALDFHREIEEAATRNRSHEGYTDFRHAPVVGIGQPTLQSAVLAGRDVEFLRTLRDEEADGDGVVPRPSATPATGGDAQYVVARHSALPGDENVGAYLGLLLRGEPTGPVLRTAARGPRLTVEMDETIPAGEPIVVRADADERVKKVGARIEDARGTEMARVPLQRDPDGGFKGEAPPLPPGTYRAVAEDADSHNVATDVFLVVDEPA